MSSAFNTKHAKLHFPSDAISDRRRRKKKARHRTAPESLIGRHRQVERCEGELEVMHRDGHLVSDRGIETPNAFQSMQICGWPHGKLSPAAMKKCRIWQRWLHSVRDDRIRSLLENPAERNR
jgi:hypothetical protein